MQVTITNGDKPKKARRSTSQRLHAKTVGNPQLETNCTATSNPGSVEATAWTLSLTHVLNGFSGSGLKKLIRSQTFTKACATNTKTRPLEELSFFLRFCLILSSQTLAKTEAFKSSTTMRVFSFDRRTRSGRFTPDTQESAALQTVTDRLTSDQHARSARNIFTGVLAAYSAPPADLVQSHVLYYSL